MPREIPHQGVWTYLLWLETKIKNSKSSSKNDNNITYKSNLFYPFSSLMEEIKIHKELFRNNHSISHWCFLSIPFCPRRVHMTLFLISSKMNSQKGLGILMTSRSRKPNQGDRGLNKYSFSMWQDIYNWRTFNLVWKLSVIRNQVGFCGKGGGVGYQINSRRIFCFASNPKSPWFPKICS